MNQPSDPQSVRLDRAKQSNLTAARREWARSVLQLQASDAETEKQTQASALSTFFRSLEQNDFHGGPEKLEAVEALLGNPDQTNSLQDQAFSRSLEQRQLLAIDKVVQWYADRLGDAAARASLSRKLQRLITPDSTPVIKRYARQVWQAADAFGIPESQPDPLATKIVRAIFQITATRAGKRQAVRTKRVAQFRDAHSASELAAAVNAIATEYTIANPTFHRPFLQQLTWTDDATNHYVLKAPLPDEHGSTVPYVQSNASARAQTGNDASAIQTTGLGKVVILVAVVCGIALKMVTLGYDRSNSDRVRQSKPPAHVSKEAMQILRDAIEKSRQLRELKQGERRDSFDERAPDGMFPGKYQGPQSQSIPRIPGVPDMLWGDEAKIEKIHEEVRAEHQRRLEESMRKFEAAERPGLDLRGGNRDGK